MTIPGFEIDRVLLSPLPLSVRLARCFELAHRLLNSESHDAVLARLASAFNLDEERRHTLASHLLGPDHVGFIVPPEADRTELVALAAAAGFPDHPVFFPSTVVARELGTLVGRDSVETFVFRATGESERGEPIGVEAFIPRASPEVVSTWIANGVGAHFALRVRSRASVVEVQRVLEAGGCRLPAFMRGRPIENPTDRVLLFYVDLPSASARRERVEFYHDKRR